MEARRQWNNSFGVVKTDHLEFYTQNIFQEWRQNKAQNEQTDSFPGLLPKTHIKRNSKKYTWVDFKNSSHALFTPQT